MSKWSGEERGRERGLHQILLSRREQETRKEEEGKQKERRQGEEIRRLEERNHEETRIGTKETGE